MRVCLWRPSIYFWIAIFLESVLDVSAVVSFCASTVRLSAYDMVCVLLCRGWDVMLEEVQMCR